MNPSRDPDAEPQGSAADSPSHESPGADVDPSASAAADAEFHHETRDEELERLRQEVETANRHALQAQAEAENFRKRMRRDFEDQIKFASLPLIGDILQVRDNLFRAVDAAGSAASVEGLRDGVAMCAKQLDDVLAKYGVKEIPTAGQPFDPNVHEAISQMPSAEHESGVVAHVALPGFQLHERVIRPSQVVVSTGAAG